MYGSPKSIDLQFLQTVMCHYNIRLVFSRFFDILDILKQIWALLRRFRGNNFCSWRRQIDMKFVQAIPCIVIEIISLTLHKKWSLLLRISSVNVTKSAETENYIWYQNTKMWTITRETIKWTKDKNVVDRPIVRPISKYQDHRKKIKIFPNEKNLGSENFRVTTPNFQNCVCF